MVLSILRSLLSYPSTAQRQKKNKGRQSTFGSKRKFDQRRPSTRDSKHFVLVEGYHGTSRRAAKKIFREGFLVGSGAAYGEGIYVAQKPELAQSYASGHGSKGVILKVRFHVPRNRVDLSGCMSEEECRKKKILIVIHPTFALIRKQKGQYVPRKWIRPVAAYDRKMKRLRV